MRAPTVILRGSLAGQPQAEKAGFKLNKVIWDEGVSGVSTKLAERPEGRRLLRELARERPEAVGRTPGLR